jgi:hypothetical protein
MIWVSTPVGLQSGQRNAPAETVFRQGHYIFIHLKVGKMFAGWI